jgi:hypothetical protein
MATLAAIAFAMLWFVHIAEVEAAFRLKTSESRFTVTGGYLARTLPADAVVLTAFQSGSVRYYAGRRTVSWDTVPLTGSSSAISSMREEASRQ